jgi:hypothetical protein
MNIEEFNNDFISNIQNIHLKNAFLNNNFNPINSLNDFINKTEIKINYDLFITRFILNLCLYNDFIYVDSLVLKILQLDMGNLIKELINNRITGLDFNICDKKSYKMFYKEVIEHNNHLNKYFPYYDISDLDDINIIISGNCFLKLLNKKKFKNNDEYKELILLNELYNDYKIHFILYNHICIKINNNI